MPIRERHGNLFPYDNFMEREELPVHRAVVGVDDVTTLPRAPWKRTGGSGTFIQLEGTFQSERGIYVADSRNNRIQILNQNCGGATVLGTTTAMNFPRGIAYDSSNNTLWVGDSGKNAVYHFNALSFMTDARPDKAATE